VRSYFDSAFTPVMRTASYTLSGTLLALTATLILEGAFSLHLLLGWLISINVFTAIFYWVDKINSVWVADNPALLALKMRIPEAALLALALAGGSPAAALMIAILPHKTSKGGFMFSFAMILIAQAVAVYLLWERLPWA
jgi:uncharacterized membrane protein YsdA (DUF1294 family)